MSLFSAIAAIFIEKRGGEHIVKSAVESYHKHMIAYPGRDPHAILALVDLAYYQATGITASQPMLEAKALNEVYLFACLPPPSCARALGLFILRRSYPDIFLRQQHLAEEYQQLMKPVNEAQDIGTWESLHEKYNPNTTHKLDDYDISLFLS